MPIPALAVAGLSAGISYLTGRSNMNQQRKQNAADRQFQMNMYNRQRQDALDDWNAQNAYNSPVQQMQRLREAGINPHAFYSGGAETTGTLIRSSTPSPSPQTAPRMNEGILPQALNDALAMQNSIWQGKQMQAQTDNLKAQNALIAAQTANTLMSTARGKLDYEQAAAVKDYAVEQARLGNQKTEADIKYTYDQNAREALSNATNVAKIGQDILESKQRMLYQRKEYLLKSGRNDVEINKINHEINAIDQAINLSKKEEVIKDINAKMEAKKLEMLRDGISPNSDTWQLTIYELWRKILGLP